MKIRKRLTLQYTGVTAAVFLVTMFTIYFWSERSLEDSFYRSLRKEAVTKAHLYLSGAADENTMHSVYENNSTFLDEVEVAVYREPFEMVYHDAVKNDIVKETSSMISSIVRDGNICFHVGRYQAVGMTYEFGGEHYVLTAAAYDGYGRSNLSSLRNMLIVITVAGLSLLLLVGYLLAYSALTPVKDIVLRMRGISANDISARLPVGRNNDELNDLSQSFNDLLDDLEQAFQSQKMFVSNVSHELRTPMAALVAETELTLLKPRDRERYETSLNNILEDSKRIIRLMEGLLNLAKADYNPSSIKMSAVRMDELLMDARTIVLKARPEYCVEVVFESEAEDDTYITVHGNVYLLSTAFVNLMENNCKFSKNHTSIVQIGYSGPNTVVRLSDNGIGIREEDREDIFRPFYRGSNSGGAAGHGIGLALAQKIFILHKGDIEIQSAPGEGTTFVVRLPHIGI